MSVRFVIGRAGTGKTHHCLAAIRDELNRGVVDGPRLVLLVPEQASLQMERALLSGEIRATGRAEVLSFQRLAFRILQTARVTERTALSSAARAMVLRTIIAQRGSQLRYFKRVERLTGFLDHLGKTIDELIEEAVAPDDLRLADASAADPRAAAKLADLADIYAAYLDYLGEELLDASQYLQLARAALPQTDYLHGARLWVDGFAGFTGQETLLLVELAARVTTAELTLLVDPGFHRSADDADGVDPADLFARPQRTYLGLRDLFTADGIEIDDPMVLSPSPPPRFVQRPELARLEARFGAMIPEDSAITDTGNVLLLEAPDRRVEVEYAVAQVSRLVWPTHGGLRYRDIAIICRDLEPYHDLLSVALAERNIPFFIDRRRATAHHPLVELVRGAAALTTGGWTIDSVRLLLKTGLLGLANDEADELENYILAHGIIGRARWVGRDWEFIKGGRDRDALSAGESAHLQRVNAARGGFVRVIGDFADSPDRPRTGAAWAEAFRDLLDRAACAATLEAWAQEREADGDMELAAQHRQILGDIDAFLDDLGTALHAVPLDATDLAAVVEAGLSQLTMGLVPPTVDQLLVSSIERSRHPEIKAAIVLGFNDGMFPMQSAEGVILNDEDRALLGDRGVRVGMTRRQRVLDELLLAYVALTRPSGKLVITYTASGDDGRALLPSPYVRQIEQALPGLRTQPIGDPVRGRATWPILTGRDLAAGLTLEFAHRPALAQDDADTRREWNDLYTVARAKPELHGHIRAALASLVDRNEALLTAESVKVLIEGTYTASVSELESFAACPFQRFARWGLGLAERREADLRPVDVGSVHHAILEEFLNTCLASNERFAEIPDAEVVRRLEEAAERIGAELHSEGELSSARDAYMLQRSARDLSPIIRGQQRVASAGQFQPRAAERKYGFPKDPSSLPALDIVTPRGRRVRVRGVIDRVDLAEVADEVIGVVVDYKRTRDKRLDIGSVYHGLSLQLLGYLLALADKGETLAGRPIVPVGAFYVSLLRKYVAVDHPDEGAGDDSQLGEALPRGVFDAGRIDVLDATTPAIGRSRFFKIFRKKDGALGNLDSVDAAETEDFTALLAHTRRKLGELADGVLDGNVSVSPYRMREFSPCQWCATRAVCRFEFGDPGMRHLEALKRTEVFDKLRHGEGDG